jgi:two-component system, chemotaxis family, protein-glutamate methylesterase/glutaminase
MESKLFAVAIGASTGGVDALLKIAAALPEHFPALVLVTLHIGTYGSVLPGLLHWRGRNPAKHPYNGERALPGTIYVAPPDQHMLLQGDRIHLSRGPKENLFRPAIDPMFRSVALSRRARSIGVVLTGQLDDGTAGLRAIKDAGGTAIVEDPATALEPSMPQSALDNVEVDWSLPLPQIVPQLTQLVTVAPDAQPTANVEDAAREQQIVEGEETMGNIENLSAIAQPSSLTCPECGGGLWEVNDRKPLRFRCHTGHAFSARSLEHAQSQTAEHALWSSVRTLHEREMLLRRLAAVSRFHGQDAQAQVQEAQADLARERARDLVRMLEGRSSGA